MVDVKKMLRFGRSGFGCCSCGHVARVIVLCFGRCLDTYGVLEEFGVQLTADDFYQRLGLKCTLSDAETLKKALGVATTGFVSVCMSTAEVFRVRT